MTFKIGNRRAGQVISTWVARKLATQPGFVVVRTRKTRFPGDETYSYGRFKGSKFGCFFLLITFFFNLVLNVNDELNAHWMNFIKKILLSLGYTRAFASYFFFKIAVFSRYLCFSYPILENLCISWSIIRLNYGA